MHTTTTTRPPKINRVHNFNPGPSTLPLEVLQTVQHELLDYRGTGMSIMETSHRTEEFEEINSATMNLLRELLGLGKEYHVIFLGGGASTQFSMIPMNFLPAGKSAAYTDTGVWANKAIKEAKLLGNVSVVASSKEQSYTYIPQIEEFKIPSDSSYFHMTSNNTIFGTQWHWWPETEQVPLVCDMSSDFCSRTLDYSKFSLIYAGAQKNIGPAGVTVVIIRDHLLAKCKDGNPTMFDYRTHVKNDSLYNTPPVFAIYMMRLVLEWIKTNGGLSGIEKINHDKQATIYGLMDKHDDFYRGTVQKDSRSWMNLTMRLPNEQLEELFLKESKTAGFIGLKGHRDVGGIRVSLYNALTLDSALQLAEFMKTFRKSH